MPQITNHSNYNITIDDVVRVRDFLEGEPAVKRKGTQYLPDPSTANSNEHGQQARYNAYLMGGEVEDFPARTLETMIGKLSRNPVNIVIPKQLEYLVSDSDGNGLTIQEAVEIAAENMLAVNYHIILCEYTKLPNGANDLSKADRQELIQRAKFSHYTREQLRDWSYDKINDVLQPNYFKLVTECSGIDENGKHTETKQLELILDKNGYRQNITIWKNHGKGDHVQSEETIIPLMNGNRIPYIPVEIVTADRSIPGRLPTKMGYIAQLVYKAHHRYLVSADLKEKLRVLQDTSVSSGWTEAKKEEFDAINNRKFFAFGTLVHNFLPEGIKFNILKMQADSDGHFRYLDENAKQVQAIGGSFNLSDNNVTATEIVDRASDEMAALNLVSNNIDCAFKRLFESAAGFENVPIDDTFKFSTNKEFFDTKMRPDEVKAVRDTYLDGLITKKMAIQKLIDGGFTRGNISDILSEIEQDQPFPVAS